MFVTATNTYFAETVYRKPHILLPAHLLFCTACRFQDS